MLTIEDISVHYGERKVLENISLELKRSEIIALLGPNGAGKTTLLRAMNGSVPVSSGEIEIGERSLSKLSRKEIAMHIAVVAQEN
ncbi:MAG: hypothetical protein DMF62_02855, partial [Acidobacteria bacterium]